MQRARRLHTSGASCLGLVLTLAAPASARAQTPEEMYQQGLELYRKGQYSQALEQFQASFEARPAFPDVLIDIGRVYLELGNGRDARFAFRSYLREKMHVQPKIRARVEQLITQAEALMANPPPAPPAPAPPAAAPPAAAPPAAAPPAAASPTPAPPAAASPAPALPAPAPPAAAPAPAAPAGQPVGFVPRDGESRYTVTAGAARCATPCELRLPPGPVSLVVDGPRRFTRGLVIPSRPARVTLQHLTVSRIAAGSVLTTLGLAFAITGVSFVATPNYTIGGQSVQYAAGVPLLVAGAGFLTGGIVNLALIRGARVDLLPASR